jgi:hypothetical protein
MAVTYLIRPITEKWTFEKIKNRKMKEMFVAFKSTKLPPLPTSTTKKKKKNKIFNIHQLVTLFKCNDSDVEEISSDEEIYLNQLVEPVDNNNVIQKLEADVGDSRNEIPADDVILIDVINDDIIDDDGMKGVDDHIVIVNEVDNPPGEQQQQQRRIKKTRSKEAKQRKNRKRNNQLRSTRFRFCLTRPYYYKFTSKQLRKILRQQGVQFRHIKKKYDQVLIGVKTDEARRDDEATLPHNCFNKKNYEAQRR